MIQFSSDWFRFRQSARSSSVTPAVAAWFHACLAAKATFIDLRKCPLLYWYRFETRYRKLSIMKCVEFDVA